MQTCLSGYACLTGSWFTPVYTGICKERFLLVASHLHVFSSYWLSVSVYYVTPPALRPRAEGLTYLSCKFVVPSHRLSVLEPRASRVYPASSSSHHTGSLSSSGGPHVSFLQVRPITPAVCIFWSVCYS